MPEDMPDRMPEDMRDRMPNRMSEDMSDRMPEDLPVRKCINVMVGITRSKVFFYFFFRRNKKAVLRYVMCLCLFQVLLLNRHSSITRGELKHRIARSK